MSSKPCSTPEEIFRPLTRDEIDRRIDTVAQALTASHGAQRAEDTASLRPRWMSAAELVRRVRPFIVLN